MSGLFIVFEGGDGSGKSTQAARLVEALRTSGRTVIATREPGGTRIAEKIRQLILDPQNLELSDRAEALLYAASRAEHVHHVVRPALQRGEIVVSDRYMDSSIIYQGLGRGLGAGQVRDLNLWATEGLRPDLTIVLDVPAHFGLERVGTPDRLELAPREMHERIRDYYLQMAASDPSHYFLISAEQTIDAIADSVRSRVDELLALHA
ncbi:MAG: dTMP kinase [Candidatus Nanopelagicales bacterium]